MTTMNGHRRVEPIASHYALKDVIGSGAFSEVYMAEDKNVPGRKVAIKCIDRKSLKGKEDQLDNEIRVMQRLEHPNIIKLHEVFEDKDKVHLVLELVTGGELFDRIVKRGFYSEKDASNLIKQIIEAIDFMHSKNVIHRDLKPENLLYYSPDDDSRIMITDFGLSQIVDDITTASLVTACGTPGYVAPEVLMHLPYGREIDIWSLGVISYILLCGYPPFYDENDTQLFKMIMKAEYQFDSPYWDNISDAAKSFVSCLMMKDPKHRFTCQQALEHEWISGGAAKDTDIYPTVAEQMKNSMARSLWKKAFNATAVVRQLQKLQLTHRQESEAAESEAAATATTVPVASPSPPPPPPSARSSKTSTTNNNTHGKSSSSSSLSSSNFSSGGNKNHQSTSKGGSSSSLSSQHHGSNSGTRPK